MKIPVTSFLVKTSGDHIYIFTYKFKTQKSGLTFIILLEFPACLKTKSCAITPDLERLNHQQSWDYLHSLHHRSLLQAQWSKINEIIRRFSYFRATKPEILRLLSIQSPIKYTTRIFDHLHFIKNTIFQLGWVISWHKVDLNQIQYVDKIVFMNMYEFLALWGKFFFN